MSALLSQLLAGFARAPELEVTGVETDSRRVTAGDAFLAVRGVGSHGLSHVEQALARGASAVVWEPAPGIAEPEELPVPQIAVAQLARQVGAIAARFHGEPAKKLFTVGVRRSTRWAHPAAISARSATAASMRSGRRATPRRTRSACRSSSPASCARASRPSRWK